MLKVAQAASAKKKRKENPLPFVRAKMSLIIARKCGRKWNFFGNQILRPTQIRSICFRCTAGAERGKSVCDTQYPRSEYCVSLSLRSPHASSKKMLLRIFFADLLFDSITRSIIYLSFIHHTIMAWRECFAHSAASLITRLRLRFLCGTLCVYTWLPGTFVFPFIRLMLSDHCWYKMYFI